ncbi:MAG: helix-hairpin-helix domain-containing protein [Candidatus Roizmanbacteria bacterium]
MEQQIRTTKIIDVKWQISRHGRYVPVAVFEPVYIEGRRLRRATAHNARKCVKDWQLTVGTKVKVTASGGIIPQIIEIVERDEDQEVILPDNTYAWSWQGIDIVLDDIEGCPEVQMKRQVHFFDTLAIPGIREGMIKRMNDGGLTTLQAILTATKADLLKINGIGPKKSTSFYDSIRQRISHAKLYRLMLASNCFPKGMGKAFLRQIAVEIPTFLSDASEPRKLKGKLLKLSGIGQKRADYFLEGLEKFTEFLQDYPNVEENNQQYFADLAEHGYNEKVEGNEFVFTELEDDDLEGYILDHQGIIAKVVSKNTTAIITGNILSMTTKRKDGLKYKVPVYTSTEFKALFQFEKSQ